MLDIIGSDDEVMDTHSTIAVSEGFLRSSRDNVLDNPLALEYSMDHLTDAQGPAPREAWRESRKRRAPANRKA